MSVLENVAIGVKRKLMGERQGLPPRLWPLVGLSPRTGFLGAYHSMMPNRLAF